AKGIADELIEHGTVSRPSFGMQLQPIAPRTAGGSPGLYVQAVTAGGPAADAGLRPGDVIVEIDGEPVASADALVVKTLTMKAGDVVHLKYQRLGATHTAELRLAAG
ncbi:MAG TPA: PDZ domain-containing protein, partial [Gaiellaceae bacterium]|nr:PDZ domain-containing protein [Gaiellaceae bacterium]